MPPFTIKFKLLSAHVLTTGVLLYLVGIFVYNNYKEAELARIDARLESASATVIGALEYAGESQDNPDVRTRISAVEKSLGGDRLQIFDDSANIIYGDSGLSRPAPVPQSSAGGMGEHFRTVHPGRGSYRAILFPLRIGERRRFVAQLAVGLHEYNESLERLEAALYTIIPFVLVLMGFASFLITRVAFRPITSMIATAEKIDAQHLQSRLAEPAAHDEVHALARTLNKMIQRINDTLDTQKQFIADASHEFRTPLTVITSELEFAQSRTIDPAIQESLRISLTEIDRLNKLSADLLLLARIDGSRVPPTIDLFSLDELLLECSQLINTEAREKNIQLRIQLGEPTTIHADREKLKSVLLNLLDNAVRYSDVGTTVSASTMQDPCRIAIVDEGPGIPPEHLQNIFKRFFRLDYSRSAGPGNGLGLSIAEHFVTLSGGTITVESEVGKGSKFVVTLPDRLRMIG